MIYDQQPKLDFSDVLIRPQPSSINSRALVNLNSKWLKRILNIDTNGIIAANMDGVGTLEVARVLREEGCMTALHKHYDTNTLIEHFSSEESSHSFYSTGMSDDDYIKLCNVMNAINRSQLPFQMKIVADVANGYMTQFGEFCRMIKTQFPDTFIMAGNVVTPDGVRNLHGVDAVKLGIGQGSNCLTRSQTGIGYPQFSCVYDTANESYDTDILFCSDGGCVETGDISKALGAGADMVMLGGMLAGSDQGGGDIIEVSGRKMVEFYGMSSATAQKKHNGGLKDYRSSEGRTTLIPYKGDIRDIIRNIKGGIVSTCTYIGVNEIDKIAAHANFIPVNSTINRSMERYTIGN